MNFKGSPTALLIAIAAGIGAVISLWLAIFGFEPFAKAQSLPAGCIGEDRDSGVLMSGACYAQTARDPLGDVGYRATLPAHAPALTPTPPGSYVAEFTPNGNVKVFTADAFVVVAGSAEADQMLGRHGVRLYERHADNDCLDDLRSSPEGTTLICFSAAARARIRGGGDE